MLPRVFATRNYLPEFVNEFLGNDGLSGIFDGYTSNTTLPSVNVAEGKDEYKIEVAAPGLSKNDFKIDVHNNILEISSEKKNENVEKKDNYVRREFNYSSFKRSFTLPDEVDTEKIKASHKDGILNILLPKKEESIDKGPRTIKVL